MMTKTTYRQAVCVFFVVATLCATMLFDWYLPRKRVVAISGNDAKRLESKSRNVDVFYIYGTENGKSYSFRNMDTGFGFPPYFKLNSSELQAEAQRLKDKEVLVRYYGRRNKILGTFPNIVSIKEYKEGMRTTSLTRGILFGLWGMFLVLLFPRYYSGMMRIGEGGKRIRKAPKA